MKTSRRLLLGTFLVLLTAPVVLVAYSRISGIGSMSALPAPDRTAPEVLATLRDFDAIEARGDFMLEVTSASDYSIDYTPLPETRGFFRARVEDGTLKIEGYGNRSEFNVVTVRITLPQLSRVEANALPGLTIGNFTTDILEVNATNVGAVVIADNRIGSLAMRTQVESITFRGNTIGNSEVRTLGTRITSD